MEQCDSFVFFVIYFNVQRLIFGVNKTYSLFFSHYVTCDCLNLGLNACTVLAYIFYFQKIDSRTLH